MPVQTSSIPLPFDDAVVVVEGRIADAGLRVEHAEGGAGSLRTRTWIVRTGATSALGGGLRIPALPSTVVVRLAATGRSACSLTLVNDGLPAVAVLDFLLLDLGPGRRADQVLHAGAPACTADP